MVTCYLRDVIDPHKLDAFEAYGKLWIRLVEKLGGSIKMHKIPLRSARFWVLSAPDVPSVLIELGYMSSPKDAELLNSESWRAQAVGAVQGAVDQYFERTQAPGKAAESRR